MTVELVYETHSTSVDNERGIATGWLDGELSELGKQQAHELGERRRNDGIAAVYVSDLGRALQTAEIAFVGTGIPVRQDARLREIDNGQLNGGSVDAVRAVQRDCLDTPFPGGESYRQVVERTRGFLSDIAARHDGERVLVIAHSANPWALQHLLDGTPLEEAVGAPFTWQPGWDYVVRENAFRSSSVIE